MSKHVAFFTSSFNIGGVERAFVTLANSFINDGYKVDFLVCYNEGQLKDQIDASINVVDLKAWRLRTSFTKLYSYLKLAKPEILITGPTYPNIVAVICNLLNKNKTKLIITQHSYQDADMEGLGMVGKIAPALTKRLYPHAHKIVAVSDNVRNDLIANYNINPQKVITIYNPVIDESFSERQNQNIPIDLKLPTEPFIVAAGRLQSIKNYGFMLRAFAELKNTQPGFNYKLVIMGEGVELDFLTKLTMELNLTTSVCFLGGVANPLPIMKRAKLLIHTSLSESMGIIYIEALQLKIPIVTLANQGANEILKDIAQATVVPGEDIQLFNNGIMIALQNLNLEDFPSLEEFKTEHVLAQYLSIMR